MDIDIEKCFDIINHEFLLRRIKHFPAINTSEKWLKCGVITNGVWLEIFEESTPQGNVISPLLCNMFLHGLEAEIGIIYDKKGYVNKRSPSMVS